MVTVISSSRYKINRKFFKKAVSQLLLNHGIGENQSINLVFIGKNKMKNIAKTYKQEAEALPILSFKYDEESNGNHLMGEIFICYPQAVLLAARRDKKVDEVILELTEHGIKNLIER